MRKLMIAAAAAALTAGAFAAEPQVYEMTLTVKTTACATNKKAVKTDCGDILFYRQQITRKYQGLFWGCGCQVIACPTEYFKGLQHDKDVTQPDQLTSYLFWSATKGYQYGLYGLDEDSEHDGGMAFRWNLLQLVGPKAANVEGAWDLVLRSTNEDKGKVAEDNEDNNIVLTVSGAGYGTAERICTENVRIKSMSGYVTGVNYVKGEIGVSGCLYCGNEDECIPFVFCEICDDLYFPYRTAMFGSWTLKFNSAATKKLAQSKPIESAYKFPKYLNVGNYTADDGTGTTEQTTAQKAEAAYKAAVKALADAEAGVKDDATIAKEIQAQEDEIKKANTDAAKAATDAATATKTADTALKAGTLSDKPTAGADVAAAKAQIVTRQGELDTAKTALETAKTEADVTKAKADIEAAEKALEDANKALANVLADIAKSTDTAENKAKFDKLVSDYDAAVAAQAIADAAATEAAAAEAEWTKTGKKEAQDAAKKASDDAKAAVADAKANLIATKAACIAAGGTCE